MLIHYEIIGKEKEKKKIMDPSENCYLIWQRGV